MMTFNHLKSLEKKIKEAQGKVGLAEEKRKKKSQRIQSLPETRARAKVSQLRSEFYVCVTEYETLTKQKYDLTEFFRR
jgi:hypothetical protein